MPILSVSNISKTYSEKTAVDGISFEANSGEIVGLLGPNGAGKTTTINMLMGVLSATTGVITINNFDIAKHHSQALRYTNFAAVYAPLPGNLTVEQNLKIFGLIYTVKNLTVRIEELLEEFGLKDYRETKTGALSSGEQTRVSLAKAMLNKPKLLLLDEPTASLDPSTAREVRQKIKKFASEGTAVLWTSHNMYEVEEVCDRVMFMSRGKILMEGDPRTLPDEHGKTSLEELFITVAREPLSLEAK